MVIMNKLVSKLSDPSIQKTVSTNPLALSSFKASVVSQMEERCTPEKLRMTLQERSIHHIINANRKKDKRLERNYTQLPAFHSIINKSIYQWRHSTNLI